MVHNDETLKEFWRKPYVKQQTLIEHKDDLLKIEKQINDGLKDYPNFLGIDFCDVSAGGIQIRGHHKAIKGYSYGSQPTIKYDFSNKDEVAQDFIEMWKSEDTPSKVRHFQNFIEMGEKYGWD